MHKFVKSKTKLLQKPTYIVDCVHCKEKKHLELDFYLVVMAF